MNTEILKILLQKLIQFITNFKEAKNRPEKTNPSNDDEGLAKAEESKSDSEVFRTERRTNFTVQQREALERAFNISQYINPKIRDELASSIGVSDRVVQTWFKNRRVKWRKERKASFKVFMEPPQTINQPFVLMPHIAYDPVNYHCHLPYSEQRCPITTMSASNVAETTTYNYLQNSSGENHPQNGYFAWNKVANKGGEERERNSNE